MNYHNDLADLDAHQLKMIQKDYGMTLAELQFLLDFHARYFRTEKSFVKRLL